MHSYTVDTHPVVVPVYVQVCTRPWSMNF